MPQDTLQCKSTRFRHCDGQVVAPMRLRRFLGNSSRLRVAQNRRYRTSQLKGEQCMPTQIEDTFGTYHVTYMVRSGPDQQMTGPHVTELACDGSRASCEILVLERAQLLYELPVQIMIESVSRKDTPMQQQTNAKQNKQKNCDHCHKETD